MSIPASRWLAPVSILAAALVSPSGARGHEIPSDVVLHVFVRPQGSSLDVLVRAPLEAMQDFRFPTRGPGYLDLERLRESGLAEQAARVWIAGHLELYEGGERLAEPELRASRVSLPSDRSFASVEEAEAHLAGPRLDPATDLVWRQALLDVHLRYAIRDPGSRFSVRPTHARLGLRVQTVLRFVPEQGVVRAYEYRGDPGLVHLDPRFYQAAASFVALGFLHILSGLDHLLFLACLVLPLRRLRPLVLVVTAFTVAHSLTLVASAYGLVPDALWFPSLVELLIALSILYMALENVFGVALHRRLVVTFAFGLVHGFGFSFALRETLQFAGSHRLTSLLAFNVGVELGQILVLLLLVPLLELALRPARERLGILVISALIAHTAWHWAGERVQALRQHFTTPGASPLLPAGSLPWLLLVLILAAAAWPALRALRSARAAGLATRSDTPDPPRDRSSTTRRDRAGALGP